MQDLVLREVACELIPPSCMGRKQPISHAFVQYVTTKARFDALEAPQYEVEIRRRQRSPTIWREAQEVVLAPSFARRVEILKARSAALLVAGEAFASTPHLCPETESGGSDLACGQIPVQIYDSLYLRSGGSSSNFECCSKDCNTNTRPGRDDWPVDSDKHRSSPPLTHLAEYSLAQFPRVRRSLSTKLCHE